MNARRTDVYSRIKIAIGSAPLGYNNTTTTTPAGPLQMTQQSVYKDSQPYKIA
jgi:hypothetical protein